MAGIILLFSATDNTSSSLFMRKSRQIDCDRFPKFMRKSWHFLDTFEISSKSKSGQ